MYQSRLIETKGKLLPTLGNAATWNAARAGKLFLKTEKKLFRTFFVIVRQFTSQKISSIDYYMYKAKIIQD